MVLTIAIENANTTIGCFQGRELLFVESISTNTVRTEFEYIMCFRYMFEMHAKEMKEVEGAIISSVVPPVTEVVRNAVRALTGTEAMLIGPGIKTGLNIATENPAQLGSDLAANAVAGIKQYEAPMIIINMGTATTLSVIDERKNYIGGMIIPGIQVSSVSLSKEAAQLPGISLGKPKRVIGTNTIECMKSGLVYGNAACIDGAVSRIEKELGKPVKTVVITGTYAKHIFPHCEREMCLHENLLLEGLRFIYEKNH